MDLQPTDHFSLSGWQFTHLENERLHELTSEVLFGSKHIRNIKELTVLWK